MVLFCFYDWVTSLRLIFSSSIEAAEDHAPDYLRKSQAEREREGKELLAGDGGSQPCQFNRLETEAP